MTFSSLLAAETELSVCHDGMTELQQKFHDSEENNRKLSQLVEDHREQIRDLTLETKRLEMENIKQTKTIEEMFKKNKLQIKQWITDMNCKIAGQGTKIEEVYRKNLQLEKKIEEKKQWITDMNCKIAGQGTKIEEVYRKNLQLEKKIEEKNKKTTADIEQKKFQPPQVMLANGVRTSPYQKSPDVRKTVVNDLRYTSLSPIKSIGKSQTSLLETKKDGNQA